MKTLQMEIALMKELNVRINIIVPNVSFGMCLGGKSLHECDLLSLSKSNYATEIEIKVSKSDLLKDKLKKHGHKHGHIKTLWFAVPEKLKEVALSEIPERAGLYIVKNNMKVYVVKNPIINKKAKKWTEKERVQLLRLGAMRILTLKNNIFKLWK